MRFFNCTIANCARRHEFIFRISRANKQKHFAHGRRSATRKEEAIFLRSRWLMGAAISRLLLPAFDGFFAHSLARRCSLSTALPLPPVVVARCESLRHCDGDDSLDSIERRARLRAYVVDLRAFSGGRCGDARSRHAQKNFEIVYVERVRGKIKRASGGNIRVH